LIIWIRKKCEGRQKGVIFVILFPGRNFYFFFFFYWLGAPQVISKRGKQKREKKGKERKKKRQRRNFNPGGISSRTLRTGRQRFSPIELFLQSLRVRVQKRYIFPL